MLVQRDLEPVVHDLHREYPAVAITGPRQSGKTTLAKMCFPDKPYVSLEDPIERAFFTDDPRGFLARYPDGAVFDEAQRCPDLLSFLQGIIDAQGRTGLFVLTGSQQFGLLEQITQSLAGRVGLLELLPFSYSELHRGGFATDDWTAMAVRGGYPPVHARALNAPRWYRNYVTTYLQRDVRQLLRVRDLASFARFLRLCANAVGQQLNTQRLASDGGIDAKTVRSWLGVLEASYLIHLLPPYFRNLNKRTTKAPKLYFWDTGVVCSLLGIADPDVLQSAPVKGALFENWVISELLKLQLNEGRPAEFYYWRDSHGLEVDLVIDAGVHAVPVEIKASLTPNPTHAAPLQKWRTWAGAWAAPGIVVYGGTEERTLKETRYVPWTRLAQMRGDLP